VETIAVRYINGASSKAQHASTDSKGFA